jgi:hypothetical protein
MGCVTPTLSRPPLLAPYCTHLQSEAEYGDDVMGRSLGTLGQSGSGKLRLVKKEKKVAKRLKAISAGSSGATGGFSSSLAFTPVQVRLRWGASSGPFLFVWRWGCGA